MKPDWKKGDVLALPGDLCPSGESVANGCHVFEADQDPNQCDQCRGRSGEWYYGARPAREVRLATLADIDRLIRINHQGLRRYSEEIIRLENLRDQLCVSST